MGSKVAPNALRLTSRKVPAGTFKKITETCFQRKFSSNKVTEAVVETKSSGGFVAWYEGHLEARPVVTKMVTGCFLWGIGDAAGQAIPHWASKDENKKDFAYDLPRTVRAAFFGFALHAPTSHVHFNFLEWMTQRAGITGYAIPFFKAFMEQVCFLWFFRGIVSICKSRLCLTRAFCLFVLFLSLCIGVGFQTPCIMVPWQLCKGSLLRNASNALKIIYGTRKWRSGLFGFRSSFSIFSSLLCAINSMLF